MPRERVCQVVGMRAEAVRQGCAHPAWGKVRRSVSWSRVREEWDGKGKTATEWDKGRP